MQFGDDEGRYIFDRLKCAIGGMSADEITDYQKTRLMDEINKVEKGSKEKMRHFFLDTGKTEDCVPYVFCFTVNITGEQAEWIKDTEVSLQFYAGDLGLEAMEAHGSFSDSCYGAARMMSCLYEDDYNEEYLKRIVLHYLWNVDNLDDAIFLIMHRVDEIRLSIMSNDLEKEMEKRLVFFLPVDKGAHPEIVNHVGKHRAGDSKGCMEVIEDKDDRYIYLDFSDSKRQISLFINPDLISVEECNEKLNGFNTKVLTFDPRWSKV